MTTIATNINKTNNHPKLTKKNNVLIEIAEVISLWAVVSTTILLIGINTWA